MRLLPSQTDKISLISFGEEACAMLKGHDYLGLADRFGYALAYDREPAAAIEADFLVATASPHKVMPGEQQSVVVKYFQPNSTCLIAVVECTVPVAEGAAVFLELIVGGEGEEKHITVEDICGVIA